MSKALRKGLAALLLLPACVTAQDKLAFSAGVDLNYKQLDTTSTTTTTGPVPVQQTLEFKPKLWTLGLTPSLAWHNVFLTATVERTIGSGTTTGYNFVGNQWLDREYDRDENSITLGYTLAGFSVFVGYMDNTTHTRFTDTGLGTTNNSVGQSDFREQAPYVGIGYSYRFDNGVSLGASLGYTSGDATLDQTTNTTSTGIATVAKTTGDLKGRSFGVSLSGPLTGSLYYRLGYKGTRYDFIGVDPSGFERKNKNNYDAFFLGVANYF